MILDEFVEIANLLEIYSSLLSEKQKEYLEDHFENDLSLSEIAKNNNVSRQAIYDNIKRGVALLYDYESKLKFYQMKKNIREELVNLKEDFTKENLEKIIENLKKELMEVIFSDNLSLFKKSIFIQGVFTYANLILSNNTSMSDKEKNKMKNYY